MLFQDYDPNSDHPFGRVNPNAPDELQQFAFMIGEFDCEDELLLNREWRKMKAIWHANYTLNGYAIQDHYRNEIYAGTSIRLYRPTQELWRVSFYGMAGGHTGVWHGSRDGDSIVLTSEQQAPDGSPVTSRLSFSNIREDGFDWLGERITADGEATANWKIWAHRRR